jgi:hypothetical protein
VTQTMLKQFEKTDGAYDPHPMGAPRASKPALLALYGDSLQPRHLQCLKRLAQSLNLQDENLTSLTVFHLVEMGLIARDDGGAMRITPLGAGLLSELETRGPADASSNETRHVL